MKCVFITISLLLAPYFVAAQGQDIKNLTFLRNKMNEERQQRYRFNEYEEIISGGAAFLIGNIGFLVSKTNTIKLSYSLIETIGIVNVGRGIYKYHGPKTNQDFYDMAIRSGKLKESEVSRYFANRLIRNFAMEERAKRLSIMWTSAFLTVQYGINLILTDISSNELKKAYMFLGSVNAMIATFSYFYRGEYESFYFAGKKILPASSRQVQIFPLYFPDLGPGIATAMTF